MKRSVQAAGWCALCVVLLMIPVPGQARDCQSELGAHLKPIVNGSGLSWTMEAVSAQGWMSGIETDRAFWSGLLLFGLDYRPTERSPHQLYLEGGWKEWYKSDEGDGPLEHDGSRLGALGYALPDKRHYGLREAYYRFDADQSTLTAGLQTMHLGDYLLLDERVLGAKLSHTRGPFTAVVLGGTVSTDFARLGDFCATRHTYRLLPGGRLNSVASDLWEANLIGGMISWSPSRESASPEAVALPGDGIEDEFAFEDVGDEFGAPDGQQGGLISEIGLVFLEEFGHGFHEYKYYYGGLTELAFPAGFRIMAELLVQQIYAEKALGYSLVAKRDFTWSSGGFTDTAVGYMGMTQIDTGARFYPAFSNLLWGEVMRLDAPDFPLYYASAKHLFPWRTKPSIKVFLVGQTQASNTRELDVEVSLRALKGLRFYAVSSRVTSDLLEGTQYMIRSGVRWAF